MKKIIYILSFFLFVSLSTVVNSQQTKDRVTIGESFWFDSKYLIEKILIKVYLPKQYEYSPKEVEYPVIYLLDAEWDFHHGTGAIQFLMANGIIPEMIVIGIENSNNKSRYKYFTQTQTDECQICGGADKFLRFLNKELMHYVDSTYRTSSFKLLFGHSLGGLFVVNTFLSQPSLFNCYIAASPTIWWDKKIFLRNEKLFSSGQKHDNYLYVTIGNESKSMKNGVDSLHSILKTKSPFDLKWKLVQMDKETHGSITHRTIYEGLEWIYTDWGFPENFEYKDLSDMEFRMNNQLEKYGIINSRFEIMINNYGYKMINEKYMNEAIAVFKFNVKHFANSSKAYDSLGEAYMINNQKDLAIENYEKSLELNPKNNNAKKMIEKLNNN
ncbi:MAG: hypothetical protein JKY33_09590 [Bacteroidia bacterium]|nr:hypothetical protein [Bacteroidia bacterium]